MFNCEEYRKKEIERVNAHKVKKKNSNFEEKHREATRKWRENKKAATESNLNNQALPQTATNSPVIHKQSLGKALKHVKNVLPGSPSKKKIVVKKLAESMGTIAKTTKAHNTSTPHDIVDQVQTFYRREDIAQFMPGKQDVVTICDENGKQKEQKQILTMTFAGVYQLFKN